MPTLFELDQFTVRATGQNGALRTRTYSLLDALGSPIGDVMPGAIGSVRAVQRFFTWSPVPVPADFVVHDAMGGVALTVARRRSGGLFTKVRIEAALADGTVVAIAHSVGHSYREYEALDPQGALVARMRRGDRLIFALTDRVGQPAGSVGLDANTLSARRAGNAHPNSYTLSFAPEAGTLLRIASLAVVLGFDSIR